MSGLSARGTLQKTCCDLVGCLLRGLKLGRGLLVLLFRMMFRFGVGNFPGKLFCRRATLTICLYILRSSNDFWTNVDCGPWVETIGTLVGPQGQKGLCFEGPLRAHLLSPISEDLESPSGL